MSFQSFCYYFLYFRDLINFNFTELRKNRIESILQIGNSFAVDCIGFLIIYVVIILTFIFIGRISTRGWLR